MKQFITLLLACILSYFLVDIFADANDYRCKVLTIFKPPLFLNFVKNIILYVLLILLWVVGMLTFYLFKNRKRALFAKTIAVSLAILPIIYPKLNLIYELKNDEEKGLKQQICAKTTMDKHKSVFLSEKLSLEEYQILSKDVDWVPTLPESFKSVDLFYTDEPLYGIYELCISSVTDNILIQSNATEFYWYLNDVQACKYFYEYVARYP